MYKRILVAVDGSDTSNAGLRHAIRLAKNVQARLRLIHVADEVTVNVETAYALEDFGSAIRRAGERILEKARAHAAKAGIQPETKLLEIQTLGRRISDSIVEEAGRWPADLIVVGTHGRRGFSHLFLGSVAEGVVRISATPVLLIRQRERKPRRGRSRSG